MKHLVAIAGSILASLLAFAAVATAMAESNPPTAEPGGAAPSAHVANSVYVVGQDSSVTVMTTLPATCTGSEATARFYTRTPDDPTPIVPSREALQSAGTAKVADDGTVSIAIPLPRELAGGPEILSAGIADPSCLDGLVLDPGSFQIAVADPSENPSGSGTVVIPVAALTARPNNGGGTYAEQVGSLTVSANGTKCTGVSLTGGPAIDADGNARIHIGTSDQPAACHEAGAELTFVNENGQTLFEKYTFLPGVTQILQNFANEPPASSGTPTTASATPSPASNGTPGVPSGSTTPLAPATGSGTGDSSAPGLWLLVLGGFVLLVGAASLGHRLSRRQ